MTVFTNVGRQCVLRILACRNRPVMTADTVSGDVRVIVIRGQPCDCCMAVVAIVAAGNVCRVLAGRSIAIVARTAAAEDLGMVDAIGWRPHSRVVAILTHVRGLNMRRIFTCRGNTVMAVGAASYNVCVIKIGRQPSVWRMTVLT